VIDWLVTEFKNSTASTCRRTEATQRLKEAAEKAKIELSTLQETTINLPFVSAKQRRPAATSSSSSRVPVFQELTDDLPACGRRVRSSRPIRDAQTTKDKIDHIIPWVARRACPRSSTW